MLTGDHPETARAVARTVGLVEGAVPVETGDDVDRMSDADLLAFLASNAVIARVDPQQKLRVVRVLQSAGEVVVVTGEGVNDAPALRAADVGVAMGLRGTEVAKQAADIVLADDNFATIVAAIEEGRSIRANIRRFLSYIVTSNVAEMAPFLLYIFLPIPLPLAVIQALAVDIGTDLLPALALGAEPPAPGVMRAAPEPPSRPLLTRRLGLRTFLFFGPLEAAIALAGFFAFYLVEGWRFGDSFAPFEGASRAAATVTFLGIVGGQVGCLVAQRDGTLRQRLSLANRAIAVGLAFEICLVLVLLYVPGLNRAVSMAAIDPAWLLTIPLAALTFMMCDELRRALGRSLSRATTAGGKPAAAGAKPA
jgi:magnesium-transporting ATPase (P-type)